MGVFELCARRFFGVDIFEGLHEIGEQHGLVAIGPG
jgi:hypothetical protein